MKPRVLLAATVAVSIVVLALGVAYRRHFMPRSDLPPVSDPSPHDARVAVPDGWRDFAVVDRVHAETAKRVSVDEGLAYDRVTWLAPLGDFFVSYETDPCIGGSACTGARLTLHDVRVGHLENGWPSLATPLDCAGDSSIDPSDAGPRSCAADSLSLRRSPDGAIYVLTFRDPDTQENAACAFTSTRTRE